MSCQLAVSEISYFHCTPLLGQLSLLPSVACVSVARWSADGAEISWSGTTWCAWRQTTICCRLLRHRRLRHIQQVRYDVTASRDRVTSRQHARPRTELALSSCTQTVWYLAINRCSRKSNKLSFKHLEIVWQVLGQITPRTLPSESNVWHVTAARVIIVITALTSTQYWNVIQRQTDRQTGGRTERYSATALSALCVTFVSRDKNERVIFSYNKVTHSDSLLNYSV